MKICYIICPVTKGIVTKSHRTLLPMPPKKRIITVDYSQSLLEKLLMAGVPAWMRGAIEKILGPLDDFKFAGTGKKTFEIEDCVFTDTIKGKSVAKRIAAEHDGWQALDVEHLIAYAIAYPRDFRKGLIFAAHHFYKNRLFMMHYNGQTMEMELLEDHLWSPTLSHFPRCRLIGEA